MCARFYFAIQQFIKHRKGLKNVKLNKAFQAFSLLQLDLNNSAVMAGITHLALDFDGVLSFHGADKPYPEIENWLKMAVQKWEGKRFFILTNRPTPERKQYFETYFPEIELIQSRKKPYPDGILAIIQKTNALPEEILVVDDRLLTGILAALITGAKPLWITRPYISLRHHPVSESFFICLRVLERLCV